MDRAPIPPHERSWRHPSELVDSSVVAEAPPAASGRRVAVATGAVAATLVVVLAITLLPRRAPAPVAMSATTLPPFSVSIAGSGADPVTSTEAPPEPAGGSATDAAEQVRLGRTAFAAPAGLVLTGSPRSVAAPVVADDGPPEQPGAGDTVHLVTTSHVYRLTWDDLDRVEAPDGTLVIDGNGRIVGTFSGGVFISD